MLWNQVLDRLPDGRAVLGVWGTMNIVVGGRAPTVVRNGSGFRHVLRSEVAGDHLAVEGVFDPFVKFPQLMLNWYLAGQRSALAALACEGNDDGPGCGAAMLADLIARLDADLARMGTRAVPIDAALPLDPLARSYLVVGSRLGTEMLRREIFTGWRSQDVPLYFRALPAGNAWRAVCAALDGVAPQSARAARIIDDSRRGFSIFARAAARQTMPDETGQEDSA